VGALGGNTNNNTGLEADISTASSRKWSFYYDDLDRLYQVSMADVVPYGTITSTVTYSTDYDGHRIAKTVSAQAVGNGTTKYVYDGDTVIEEISPWGTTYELPGAGYVTNGTQYYSWDNAEGSTLSTVNSAGALQSRNEYDGYGMTHPDVSGPQSDFRFVGAKSYVTDDDTGFDMLGRRFYIPQLGRFLNQDPIGQAGGLNIYEYAGDSPVTGTDPSGLAGEDDEDEEEYLAELPQIERDEEFGHLGGNLKAEELRDAINRDTARHSLGIAVFENIDESAREFDARELALATRLASEGDYVSALPENRSEPGRKGDALVNGIRTEFKSLDPGADSETIRNVVSKSIRGGGQARDIIIDARFSDLGRSDALRGIRRVGGFSGGRLDSLRIIGNGFDVIGRY